MRNILLPALFLLTLCGGSAFADKVVLTNGDQITGEIQSVEDGKLTIETEKIGTVKVDVADIKTLATDTPVHLTLADGTAIEQKVQPAEPGKIAVAGDETLLPWTLDLANVATLKRVQKSAATWKANIVGAYTVTNGNSNTHQGSVDADLTRRGENDRATMTAGYLYGRQKDVDTGEETKTADRWYASGKYDYFLTKKLFVYESARVEHDAVADLDTRLLLGAGAGYQWAESPKMNFSTQAGLGYRYEDYRADTANTSQATAQLGYHFDRKLTSMLTFLNDVMYYPTLQKWSEYLLSTQAEMRADLSKHLFASLKVKVDENSTPAPDKKSTDTTYILGLGVHFF